MKSYCLAIAFRSAGDSPRRGGNVSACPFCSVESQTLSEETRGADAVVLAKLVKEARADERMRADPNSGTATFQDRRSAARPGVAEGREGNRRRVFWRFRSRADVSHDTGIGKDKIDWTTPLPLSAAAVEYVRSLPTCRAERAGSAGVLSGLPGARRSAVGPGCLRRICPGAVFGAARAEAADEARPDREMDRRSRGQPEPAAVVFHDARRVRQQGRRADARNR